jgi:hypothetical protein
MENASFYKSPVLKAARINGFSGLGATGNGGIGFAGLLGLALMYGALGAPGSKPILESVSKVVKFNKQETLKVATFAAGGLLLLSGSA